MNTKTAEEILDLQKLATENLGIPYNGNSQIRFDGYMWGAERIWNDHVVPLKKRIEELEAVISSVEEYIQPGMVNGPEIMKLLHPSTNGKQD